MSKPDLKGLDLHSEEVQELMGAVPSWIQRWGISLVTLILIVAIILCNYISLPQKSKINLYPLPTENVVVISTPQDGKITSLLVKNNASILAGDTILIYQSSTGAESIITSPIDGLCTFTGPITSSEKLPGEIELLQVNKSGEHSFPYYGYLPAEDYNMIHIGDLLLIDSDYTAHITFISPNPASNGQYYFEASSPLNSNQSPITVTRITSTESVLQKIIRQLSPRLKQT